MDMVVEFTREFALQIALEDGEEECQKNDEGDPDRPEDLFAQVLFICGELVGQNNPLRVS